MKLEQEDEECCQSSLMVWLKLHHHLPPIRAGSKPRTFSTSPSGRVSPSGTISTKSMLMRAPKEAATDMTCESGYSPFSARGAGAEVSHARGTTNPSRSA